MRVVSRELTVIYEHGDDGWWIATIPEIPGAFSQGKTKKEARENAFDAMNELMLARRDLALKERSEASSIESVAFGA